MIPWVFDMPSADGVFLVLCKNAKKMIQKRSSKNVQKRSHGYSKRHYVRMENLEIICNTFKSKSNNFEGPLILLIYFTWFTFISKVSHFQFPYSLSFLFRCLLCVTLVIFPYAFMLSKYWIYLHLYIFTVFYISVFFNPVYSHRQKAGISGVYININMYINMFIYIYIFIQTLFKFIQYSNVKIWCKGTFIYIYNLPSVRFDHPVYRGSVMTTHIIMLFAWVVEHSLIH